MIRDICLSFIGHCFLGVPCSLRNICAQNQLAGKKISWQKMRAFGSEQPQLSVPCYLAAAVLPFSVLLQTAFRALRVRLLGESHVLRRALQEGMGLGVGHGQGCRMYQTVTKK